MMTRISVWLCTVITYSRIRLTLIVCLFLFNKALAAQTLIWVSEMSAPNAKPSSGVNLENRLFDLLSEEANLPYQYQQANNLRAESILLSHNNACTGNKLKTRQRTETFAMTRLPQTLFLGQRLYSSNPAIKDAIAATQNAQHQVQIEKLLQLPDELVFGIQEGRSYGDIVDAIISQAETSRSIYRRNDQGTARGMVDMLLAGRVDFIIEYPNVLHHYQSTSLRADTPLYSFSVAELNNYQTGYIMCSPGPQGEKLAARLNQAIAQASQQRDYLQLHLDWYTADTHKELTQLYNQVYQTGF